MASLNFTIQFEVSTSLDADDLRAPSRAASNQATTIRDMREEGDRRAAAYRAKLAERQDETETVVPFISDEQVEVAYEAFMSHPGFIRESMRAALEAAASVV